MILFSAQQEPKGQKRSMATKLPGPADQRLARISEVQRLHLAEPGKAVSGQDSGRISLQLGASFISRQAGSGTSAAKADFSFSFTAGLKACSTPSTPVIDK
jgi:hypothetical protein